MKQVIYINSRPFVLRDVEQPFSNLEYTVRIALNSCPETLNFLSLLGRMIVMWMEVNPWKKLK